MSEYKSQIESEAQKVRDAGGLFIIGTERHESRRIDNQLRGRSGRQGDPGESRFYLSLEDDLMRLFSSERVMRMMDAMGIDEDTPIDAKILSGAVENAQKSVESRNLQARKSVLEYDNVMNTQRTVIYDQRMQVLDGKDLRQNILTMLRQFVDMTVAETLSEFGGVVDESSLPAVLQQFEGLFFPEGAFGQPDKLPTAGELADYIYDLSEAHYQTIEQFVTETVWVRGDQRISIDMRELERTTMLRVVDEYWMDHIDAMDDLKQGIRLRAYAQHDPVVAYKEEGYQMFAAMNQSIKEETIRKLFAIPLQASRKADRTRVAKETNASGTPDGTVKNQPVKSAKKAGPNDPCPCGSGKKYKKCCMQKDKSL